jgi:hypothetical protein
MTLSRSASATVQGGEDLGPALKAGQAVWIGRARGAVP